MGLCIAADADRADGGNYGLVCGDCPSDRTADAAARDCGHRGAELVAHAVCGDFAEYCLRFCGLGAKLFARSAEWAVSNSGRCDDLLNRERFFAAFRWAKCL